MTVTNYVKLQDQPHPSSDLGRNEPLDTTSLLGTWLNTNKATTGITKAVVQQGDGGLRLRVFGACEPEPCDWGEVSVNALFSDGMGSDIAISFTAEYDFGFLETELQTNLSKGLLIVTSLNRFKDGSARSDFFTREYFYKEPGSG